MLIRSEALAAARVDTSLLIDTRQLPTSGTLVINVCGEDRRFIHAVGANAEYTGADLTAEVIESARVSYLGGFCLMPGLSGDCARRLFRTARQGGATTVLDVAIPDSRDWWPELRKVLPWTDVFLPNTDEARQLTGLDDPRRQAERFAAAGAGAVVITCGSEGAVLLDSRSRHSARAFAVECVDGTGSGDAFAAGYIDGLLQGLPAIRCLEIAPEVTVRVARRAIAGRLKRQGLTLADYPWP
jgi:sugar/nucleoside kinase (ribokinase family)